MDQELHDLVAPYALDALEPGERTTFERHLDECAVCNSQLAELQEATTALAYAESAEPPPELKQRILDVAGAENGAQVIPFPKRRWIAPATGAIAAAAAAAAIVLGIWASSLSNDLDRERSAKSDYARALELIGGEGTVSRLAKGSGSLVVARDGQAALVLCNLERAPSGKTYEAWIIQGGTSRAAGLFPGGSGCPPVLLDEQVPRGSQIAVTLERSGGAPSPTGPILASSERV